MWLYLEPLVQEMVSCDAFDHNLTDDLGEMLLTSGGTGPEVMRFHHGINKFLEEHQTGLEEIVFLAPKKQLARMKERKLMPSDLFRKAKEDYRKLYNSGKWPPSSNIKSLSGTPPTTNSLPTSILQATANALVQAMNKNNSKSQNRDKKRNCFHCGQTGHFKANCPQLKGNNGSNYKSRRNNPGRNNKDKWKTTGPGPNDPQEKTVNSKKFFWCGTCKRWSTTHSTATHVKRSEPGLEANLAPTFGSFAWCAPFPIHHGHTVNEESSSKNETLCFWGLIVLLTTGAFMAWINEYALLCLPPLLWLGLLGLGLTIPKLAPPETEPRRLRRHKTLTTRKTRKRQKR
jgi:hypothetical protein